MKIGIISENFDNDSAALKALLEKHTFKKKQKTVKVSFRPIGRKIEGDHLLTPKSARIIDAECKRYDIDLVVLVKDLDGLPSNQKKIKQLTNKIQKIANQATTKLLPFIVIFEQEALILADIQTFNRIYKTTHKSTKNPLFQSEPKELLKRLTSKSNKKYRESDTPEIFQQLDFQKVYQNHKGENSFQSFIDQLEKEII